jgi:hypothetical protein
MPVLSDKSYIFEEFHVAKVVIKCTNINKSRQHGLDIILHITDLRAYRFQNY